MDSSNDSDSESVQSSQSSQSVGERNVNLRSALPEAIKRGSVKDVRRLLKQRGAVRIRFKHHFDRYLNKPDSETTPLMLAAGLGHIDIVDLLLDHGASVDDVTSLDSSAPIHLAALHGQSGVVKLLLNAGAPINDRNADGWTPLELACKWGHLETAKSLISRGADPNRADTNGWNSLSYAARYGQPHITRYLLDLETDIEENGTVVHKKLVNRNETADKNKYTPLIGAIHYSHIDCVKLLLADSDVDVTIQDSDAETALCMAARKGYISIMLQILGMKVYLPDDPVSGTSCIASSSEHYYVERTLLRRHGQAMRTPEEQARTMYWAVANGCLQLTKSCLQHQPNLAKWSRMGATWLHVAAKYGRHQLLELFAAQGLDICAMASQSMTPLHLAAQGGHRVAVKCILQILRRRPKKAKEPPAGVSSFPVPELVQFILQPNDDGESSLTLSGKSSTRGGSDILWGEIEKFAESERNFVESLPIGLEDLLELAAQFERPGKERMLKMLLQQTTSKRFSEESKHWTALHWAVASSRAVIVWWLLSNGAHLRSEEIQTALQIVEKKASYGYGSSEVDLLMTDLLRNPPTISARAVNGDDYHLPELPTFSDDLEEVLDHDGIVVDFYCHDKKSDFKIKRRSLRAIIYEEGPSGVMESVGSYDCSNLEGLKDQLETIRQTQYSGKTTFIEPVTRTLDFKPHSAEIHTTGQESFETSSSHKPTLPFAPAERQHGFRWIHIPAHDIKLAEDLITRIIRDSGKKKRQHASLVDLLKQTSVEVAAGGGKRYIKPQCVRGQFDDDVWTSNKSGVSQDAIGEDDNDDDKYDDTNESTDANTYFERSSEEGSAGKQSVALYMPFLTLVNVPGVTTGIDVNESTRQYLKSYAPSQRSHENCSSKIPYGRMTLDQYYYTTIPDSTERDHDQVLSRYLAWQEFRYFKDHGMKLTEVHEQSGKSIKIFAVDQLWLWIVDESTIITATTSDFEDFVDIVFDTLVSADAKGDSPRAQSVHSMMECILKIVTGPRMQSVSVMGKEKLKQPMEVFRESIRHVADVETEMSRNFVNSVARGHFNILPKREMGKEFRLLYEIKDIREELNMLSSLTETQNRVWRQARLPKYPHFQTPHQASLEIKEVVREAESAQDAINTLLELRQKHAGNQDAEFGRQQANTTMVFTIVTIIFLPLSFLTSLFALDVSAFPHESGDVKYKSAWIFPIIFGCTAAFSIPSIIVAFNINDLILVPYYRWRSSTQPDSNRIMGADTVRQLTEEADISSIWSDAVKEYKSSMSRPKLGIMFILWLLWRPSRHRRRRTTNDCETGGGGKVGDESHLRSGDEKDSRRSDIGN